MSGTKRIGEGGATGIHRKILHLPPASITSLTPQQEQDLVDTIEHWLKIINSVEPLNRARATRAVTEIYRAAGMPEPVVLVFSSPMMCTLAREALRAMVWMGEQNGLSRYPVSRRWTKLNAEIVVSVLSLLTMPSVFWKAPQYWINSWLHVCEKFWSELDNQVRTQLGRLESQLIVETLCRLDASRISQQHMSSSATKLFFFDFLKANEGKGLNLSERLSHRLFETHYRIEKQLDRQMDWQVRIQVLDHWHSPDPGAK